MCIDKSAAGKATSADALAIAALPITVGACRKVLILLSPSYLKRIWCVWELHAVFAFCIKELAADRVVVLDAHGGSALRSDLLNWSLDDAHCFDPNEELRLRRLVSIIGKDSFVECVRALATCALVRGATPRTKGMCGGVRQRRR